MVVLACLGHMHCTWQYTLVTSLNWSTRKICIHTFACNLDLGCSSAESVSGACDGLFLKRILAFVMDCPITMRMRTDNQAARQIALKQGVSKIRHLDGRYLWVQEQIAAGEFAVGPIDGRINPADVGAKVPASQARLKALLRFLGVVQVFGQTIEPVGEEECNALRQSVFRQHETARVRRLLNKALRVQVLHCVPLFLGSCQMWQMHVILKAQMSLKLFDQPQTRRTAST